MCSGVLRWENVALTGAGYRATFMPKPFVNKTGNGTHCHVSVWNDNSNLFEDSAGELVNFCQLYRLL